MPKNLRESEAASTVITPFHVFGGTTQTRVLLDRTGISERAVLEDEIPSKRSSSSSASRYLTRPFHRLRVDACAEDELRSYAQMQNNRCSMRTCKFLTPYAHLETGK